jgi:hypothetical protein
MPLPKSESDIRRFPTGDVNDARCARALLLWAGPHTLGLDLSPGDRLPLTNMGSSACAR